MKTDDKQIALIDKIHVPKSSIPELMQQSEKIAGFIRTQPGLLSQEEFEQVDAEGNLTLVTVAVWENQEAIAKAREAVRGRFYDNDENTEELMQRLKVKMERGLYNRRVL